MTCEACGVGKYRKINDRDMVELLSNQIPYLVSKADDWDHGKKEFASTCGGRACRGGTGKLMGGHVSTGRIAGNFAAIEVPYVQGTPESRIQWGAL